VVDCFSSKEVDRGGRPGLRRYDGLLCGLGRKQRKNSESIFQFLEAEMDGFKMEFEFE
jgi:hypothetical protein